MKFGSILLALALMAAVASVQAFVVPQITPTRLNHNNGVSFMATTTTDNTENKNLSAGDMFKNLALAGAFAMAMFANPLPSLADGQTSKFRLPPIDYSDKSRCTISSSSMGQSNAARDKLYDLRECRLPNSKGMGYDLSGVIMTDTDVSGSDFSEAYFSKGYLQDSKFDNVDFTNAIVDRASFKGSSLQGAIFTNAVLTGTSFEGANVENADFTEAAIGDYDLRNLCKNPTLKGENPKTGMETRLSVGCK